MTYKEPTFRPTRDEMLNIIKENIIPMNRKEIVSIEDALGRISSSDVFASYSLPNAPVSSFDGISVRFEDFKNGIPDTSNWKEGKEYKFSNTGVAISPEFDTIIAIENVDFDTDGHMKISKCPERCGNGVGKIGNHMAEGEILLYKGEKITPSHIGLLVSAGITNITVYNKPVVTFIPTGDELVPLGMDVPLGKNVESNGKMLEAYIKEWGGIPILYPIISDDIDQLKFAIQEALKSSDIVLICAGSAKGSKDYTMDVLDEVGEILVRELGHGPGKHCSLTMAGDKPIIGLPGPAMGAELTANIYVKGALAFMNYQDYPWSETVNAILTEDIKGAWIDFIFSMYVYRENGEIYVKRANPKSETRAGGYRASNGKFYCPKGKLIKAGEVIPIELSVPGYKLR